MALKVGGTTVINDNRALENISNLKTINGQSLLGAGDLTITGSSTFTTDVTINTIKFGRGPGDIYMGGISSNIAIGQDPLGNNTTGAANVGIGGNVLSSNTSGNGNVALGQNASQLNTTGNYNVAIGYNALTQNATGWANIAIGQNALNKNIRGGNLAIGANTLTENTTGTGNAAIGDVALQFNTTGNDNVGVGSGAIRRNTTGQYNTAVGSGALSANVTGNCNVAIGTSAIAQANSNNDNTAVGFSALVNLSTGGNNIAIGRAALLNCTTGSGNLCFGSMWGTGNGTYSPVFDVTTQNYRVVMGHTGITNAYIQVAWTVVSDARDKTNFKVVPHGLDFVNRLKPTAYQFRKNRESNETSGGVRYGFKAQDIADIEPEGVIVDTTNSEKYYYNESNLVPVLVKAIQELSSKNEKLEARIIALESK